MTRKEIAAKTKAHLLQMAVHFEQEELQSPDDALESDAGYKKLMTLFQTSINYLSQAQLLVMATKGQVVVPVQKYVLPLTNTISGAELCLWVAQNLNQKPEDIAIIQQPGNLNNPQYVAFVYVDGNILATLKYDIPKHQYELEVV